MCFRWPGEPRDERPMIDVRDVWASFEEEAAYMRAVRENPRVVDLEAGTIENSKAYIVRLAEIVAQGPLVVAKRFPPKHRIPKEYTGPRPQVTEGNLTFEDRTDAIYERQPGEDG